MQLPLPFNLLPDHEPLWTRITSIIDSGRIAHAFLMIGPRHASVIKFVNRFVARLLCLQPNSPCGQCQACRMLIEGFHPDVMYVSPEASKGSIKIEQIRTIQLDVYQTPQLASRRFIIIDPADKLNRQSANALLKILEEPPEHTIFILIAEHINQVPATIISRCQQYVVPVPKFMKEPVAIAAWYEAPTERAALYAERFAIIALLNDLVAGNITPCEIAQKWSNYQLENIAWFLYLLTAEAIEYKMFDEKSCDSLHTDLYNFAKAQSDDQLFKQLNAINAIFRIIQQNITLNQALVLENLLMGYLPC